MLFADLERDVQPGALPRPYTLVEPCCGLAALSLHMLGARQGLLPYQGGKWRWRRDLAALLARVGAVGAPTRLELDDVGATPAVLAAVLHRATRLGVIDQLDLLAKLDPLKVYLALNRAAVPRDRATFAAQWLFLSRLAFSGKVVGVYQGAWISPGFNKTSAFGAEPRARFGEVRPMVPALLEALRAMDIDITVHRPGGGDGLVVTYLDPPYAGTTRYPGGHLDRGSVIARALGAHVRGPVLVSEAEPIPDLVERGWLAVRLGRAPEHDAPFRGRHAEWVTCSPEFRCE